MQNSQFETSAALGGSRTRSGGGSRLSGAITLILIVLLILVALLLPPINLLERLQALTYTRVTPAGGMLTDPDGTTVVFPAEGITKSFFAKLESTPRADFIAGEGGSDLYDAASNLPQYLIPKSPYYRMDVRGSQPTLTELDIPIPNDSLPYETLGLYNWNGSEWALVPNQVLAAEDKIVASVDYPPTGFMVMQTTPGVPAVTANLGEYAQLPQGAVVTYEAKAGLLLRGDGALDGVAPVNSGNTMPIIRNWEGEVVRTDLINNLLIDPGLQANQLVAVEQTVVQNGYPGAIIDYRGVDALPSARADYVRLISDLADRLHAAGKTLTVRVEPPHQISAEEWDTGGYDWRNLGEVVDTLVVPAPIDPRAYDDNAELDAMLTFATSEVERNKLQFELPSYSIERAGSYLLMKGYQESLLPLVNQIQLSNPEGSDQIEISLQDERLLSEVIWDDAIGMYYYVYRDDQGGERTVYIENADSTARKLNKLQAYNVRDASTVVPDNGDIDPLIWSVLLQFQQGQPLTYGLGQLAVNFAVYDENGNLVAQETTPLTDATTTITPPAGAGDLSVEAQIINSAGQPVVKSQPVAVALDPDPAPAAVASTETAAVASGPTLNSSQIVNVREGPSTLYNILGQVSPGTSYAITGKNEAGDWWQIDFNGQPGWVIGQLASTSGDAGAIAVATNIPEPPEQVAVAAAPADAGAAPAAAPAAAPVVAAPPPSGAIPFGYGVQAHMVDNGQAGQVMAMTQGMGFNWVKQQIEWKRFEPSPGAYEFGGMDEIVNAANGAGINLLFSIVNSPTWAREPGFDGSVGGPPVDPQTYANFVGQVAGKYCGSSLKMIEVWNEQNLHYEWGNKPLNPGEYVQLLAPAYAAIKAACPSMWVVSGAPTPAGNNPPYAMDDFTYLEEMFKAGANNYLDAVGAHPSGYNVPPDDTWETACDAIIKNGNSFNGACDSPHHSWSFRSTMEG
jgi:uncharacterized protein YgiM (DUF1202 family)